MIRRQRQIRNRPAVCRETPVIIRSAQGTFRYLAVEPAILEELTVLAV